MNNTTEKPLPPPISATQYIAELKQQPMPDLTKIMGSKIEVINCDKMSMEEFTQGIDEARAAINPAGEIKSLFRELFQLTHKAVFNGDHVRLEVIPKPSPRVTTSGYVSINITGNSRAGEYRALLDFTPASGEEQSTIAGLRMAITKLKMLFE